MTDSPKQLILLPFLVSFAGSIAIAFVSLWSGPDEMAEWQVLPILFWWPVISLGFSVLLIQRVSKRFRTHYADEASDLRAWRLGTRESFAAMACIVVAAVVGATPQTWWVVQLWPSKGLLMAPLGAIMLLQCLVTAWAIAVCTSTMASGMRIGTILAHLLFGAAFIGNWFVLRFITGLIALPYLGGNRIDGFSPLMLYLQRFRFDRPVSRLHLMYASSLTMFALGGALLLLTSFFVAVARSRRTP